MENKRFERVFLLFAREDHDVYGGQSPSGFVKIETVENRVKISSSIQGLNLYTSEELSLYIFGRSFNEISFYDAGRLQTRQSKCELVKEVILDNAKDCEGLRNIEGAVVAGIRVIRDIPQIYCPLTAFRNNLKVEYREALSNLLLTPKEEPEISIPINPEKEEVIENSPVIEEVVDLKVFEDTPGTETEPEEITDREEATEEIIQNANNDVELQFNDVNQDSKEAGEYEQYQNMLRQLGFFKDRAEYSEICREPSTDLQREVCSNCNKAADEENEINKQPMTSAKLRLIFNKHFETYDPFKIKRQDYRWWKVGSPVQLNDILYQNNIKTPLLFNPQLMMAHFKYRHILIGIYSNRRQRKEYVVCGVPSIYNIDEKPFGEYCRWAQIESTKPRHGAFGYWLVYIDIRTGNFLPI